MSGPGLRLAGVDLETIFEHCRRELPNEACGILGGRDGRVESVHSVRNTLASPARYAMDPAEQFRALDWIDRAGQEVVGLYHSHPGGHAVPSREDAAGSCWPGALPSFPEAVQVIVSFGQRDNPELKGYVPAAGAFVEVPIVVTQEDGPGSASAPSC